MVFVSLVEALALPRQKERTRGYAATIYALTDPIDNRVRYVGKTRCQLEERLRRHLETPTNPLMASWLSEMAEQRRNPRIVALEYVCYFEWEAAERGWIHWFRQKGDLLNVDPGGEYRTKDGAKRSVTFGEFRPPAARSAAKTVRMLVKEDPESRAAIHAKQCAEAAAGREETRRRSGPVRRLPRDEIRAIYGAKATGAK